MSQAAAPAPPPPTGAPAPLPAPAPAPSAPAPAQPRAVDAALAQARGIPTTLGRLRLVAALAVLAFTALTVLQLVLGMNAASRAAADAEQVIRVQDLKVDLLRADALATNAFLVGGLEPSEQRAQYDAALADASRTIAAAAQAQSADQAALAELSALVLTYGSDMEAARAYNRQGLPVGSAYLREASADLRGRGMTIVGALLDANTQRAQASFDDQHPLWVALPGLVTLALLVVVNTWMAKRFRRRLNVGVAAAAAAVLALTGAAVFASLSQAGENATLRAGDYKELVDGAQARGAAYSAKSNESLRLVARGSGKAFEEAWAKDDATVTKAAPGEHTSLWEAYEKAHKALVTADDGGDWDKAVQLATSRTEGSTPAFEAFDKALAGVVTSRSETVTQALAAGRFLPLGAALATLLGGLAATWALWQGIGRRLGEYS